MEGANSGRVMARSSTSDTPIVKVHRLRLAVTACIAAALSLGGCSAEPPPSTPRRPATRTAALATPAETPSFTGPPRSPVERPAFTTPPVETPAFTMPPVEAIDPVAAAARYEAGRHLFEYDASLPLNITPSAESVPGLRHAEVHDMTYDSPAGGRVGALLVEPNAAGPYPALVVQHGLPGRRTDLLDEALDLAQAGAAAVLIDAPHARAQRIGPGTNPVNFTEQDRAEQIQLIVDLRRAVDLLQTRPEIDPERIGYLGVSYGGAMGGLLAGIESRIDAYVLVVGDGGIVAHFSGADDVGGPLDTMAPERRDAWLAAMEPIEPIYYVGQAGVPILFQSGQRDELVPPADAAALHPAANELATVTWYDAGHGLNREARCDAAVWLGEHLGFDGAATAPCS
jgi:dienelactone hydrolase